MPKKKWTEEERKAFGEKMKAARAKKEKVEKPKAEEPKANQEETIASEATIKELLDRIKQLENRDYATPSAQVTSRGLIGTVEKYSTNEDLYEDPREKLAKEPKLKQFAFDVNYELEWQIDVSNYETKDGINMKEPRFTLQLNKVKFDDDGNDTRKRIVVKRHVMHEDPQAALVIAKDNGVIVDQSNEIQFLNDMRYLRLRDWLLGIFYPTKSSVHKVKSQEVIGGKLVEVFQINAAEPQPIPFNEMR